MNVNYESINEGDNIPAFSVKMDRTTYFKYNELVNEFNPLHFNDKYAKSLGFKDIVVAGVYTFSFAPRLIADWLGEPGRIKSIEVKYIKPAYIEDEVTYKGVVKNKRLEDNRKIVECEVYSENSEGTRLLEAKVALNMD